jgi:hypothetical protein
MTGEAVEILAKVGVRTEIQMLSLGERLGAIGLGAGVADEVPLAVETDDEEGASVHFAAGLVGGENRGLIAFGIDVADALAETASAELIGAAEIVDGVVGVERSDAELHGTEMLVAEWEEVDPHEQERIAVPGSQYLEHRVFSTKYREKL